MLSDRSARRADRGGAVRDARPAVLSAGASRAPGATAPNGLVDLAGHPWRPPLSHDVVGRKGLGRGDGDAAEIRRGYEYVAICDHTPNVRVVPGLDADALMRQAEEIDRVNDDLAPFRVLRGVECDILADGSLDLEDTVLESLDWVQLSLHAGQRRSRDDLTRIVTAAMRHPNVRALSHPKGRILNHRPRERPRPRRGVRGRDRDRRCARGQRPSRSPGSLGDTRPRGSRRGSAAGVEL